MRTWPKDRVNVHPHAISRVKARFDVEGLCVWHCHILEHEDNEMMRPYYVGAMPEGPDPMKSAKSPASSK
jgi:FtsP/CotA-like multicopper oxidase with cupredoxin domain